MSPSGHALWHAIKRAVRRVRSDGVLAVALAALAVVPAVLLVAWLLGGSGWGVRSVGPLVLVSLGAAVILGIAVVLGRRWVAAVDEGVVATAAEDRQGLPEGSLRGVLELGRELPPGVSAALFRRTEAELAGRLSGSPPSALAGAVGDRARRRRTRLAAAFAAGVAVVAVAGLATPDRARAAWTPLLQPVHHAAGPALPPIRVLPGDTSVTRSATVDVAITAPLRSSVTLHWRTTGDVPGSSRLPVTEGRAQGPLGPVDAPIVYWVTAPDGSATDTFRVRPVDPLLVSRLTVDVSYPAHLGRPVDHYEGDVGTLRIPEGSRIRIRGTATRSLDGVSLEREDGRAVVATVEGQGFSMDWRPDAEAAGRWAWRVRGDGSVPAVDPAPIDLVMVVDAPPEVRITVPGRDTLLDPSLREVIVADASDDHALVAAALVFWRVDGYGREGTVVRTRIGVDGGDRSLLRTVLDAKGQSLAPGDAIHYRIEVLDNAPGGQVGRSGTYALRLPGRSELRDQARSDAERLIEEASRLSREARELETTTRDLGRQSAGQGRQGQAGGRPGRSSGSESVDFEEASEARQVAQDQEELLKQAAELQQRMRELQEAVEAAGLEDPALRERLEELRDLYEQLATPELKQELQSLRQAVDDLDPEAVREALERLAQQQQELRERLEESLELMKRAAAQQEMSSLAREAEEVAARQQALAEAMREETRQPGGPSSSGSEAAARDSASRSGAPDRTRPGDERTEGADSTSGERTPSLDPNLPTPDLSRPDRARQQDELRDRTERLGESMKSLQQQLAQLGEQDAAQSTGSAQQQSEGAQQSMQRASSQARQQQGEQAAQSGEQAASQMSDAARTLDGARQRMTESWREQTEQAMQQATQEALDLAQREESLRQQMEQTRQQGGAQGQGLQQMRSEQAALQQGLEQLGRNLSEAGQRSGSVNRDVGQSLARAMLDMQQTAQGLEDGSGRMPVQQAARSVESLNQLAMSLLQNETQMQGAQGGSALQQALEQLSELAREQGSLNGRMGALGELRLEPQAMTRQLQQAAKRQGDIARRVGDANSMLSKQEGVLGQLDAMSAEAESIARELEGGRLTPEVRARQERLFHRLLDAGRTLERDEYSDERVAERPGAVDPASPEAVDPALLEAIQRYRVPSAAELRALPPAYRRMILEYFDRLNREPSGGGG